MNVVAVKEGRQGDAAIVALVKALKGEQVKAYVASHYVNGEVVLVTE